MGTGISPGRPLPNWTANFKGSKEYRGFSIVFSGNKSLHFHFIFSTEHLQNVPSWGGRRRSPGRISAEPPPSCTMSIIDTGTTSMKVLFGS